MGAAVRRSLDRASPAPRTEGALLGPVNAGRGVSGGWRDRKGLPRSARTINRTVGIVALAGAAMLIGTRAAKARL